MLLRPSRRARIVRAFSQSGEPSEAARHRFPAWACGGYAPPRPAAGDRRRPPAPPRWGVAPLPVNARRLCNHACGTCLVATLHVTALARHARTALPLARPPRRARIVRAFSQSGEPSEASRPRFPAWAFGGCAPGPVKNAVALATPVAHASWQTDTSLRPTRHARLTWPLARTSSLWRRARCAPYTGQCARTLARSPLPRSTALALGRAILGAHDQAKVLDQLKRLRRVDDRAGEVFALDADPRDRRAAQVGASQLGVAKIRAAQVALPEHRAGEVRAVERGLLQRAVLKPHLLQARRPVARHAGVAVREAHVGEVGVADLDTHQPAAEQLDAPQVGFVEPAAGEVAGVEAAVGQLNQRQAGLAEAAAAHVELLERYVLGLLRVEAQVAPRLAGVAGARRQLDGGLVLEWHAG